MRKAFLVTGPFAGIAMVALALLPACSSQASAGRSQSESRNTAQNTLSVEAQATERARLALKASAKDDALQFVRVAQSACRELTRKTEALTAASNIEFSELNSFIPPEIYPPDAFASYVGATIFEDVKSQLSQLVATLVDLLRTLSRNSVTAISGVERTPDEVIKDQALFQEKKLKMLSSTNAYCESIRRAGAGIGSLQ